MSVERDVTENDIVTQCHATILVRQQNPQMSIKTVTLIAE